MFKLESVSDLHQHRVMLLRAVYIFEFNVDFKMRVLTVEVRSEYHQGEIAVL